MSEIKQDSWAEGRKREVSRLLTKLGGRARWSQLEKEPRKLSKSPTTLKNILDEMEKEGTIYVEAKRGLSGPEVWYVLQLPQRTRGGEGEYAAWEFTDLDDVRRAAEHVDALMDADLPRDLKFDLLGRFLEAALGFLSGNIMLNISDAVQREDVHAVLADVTGFVDRYVTPSIRFLATYCWSQGPELSGWLMLIGSGIAHDAKKSFNPEYITELMEKEPASENEVPRQAREDLDEEANRRG